MKTIKFGFLGTLIAFGSLACKNDTTPEVKTVDVVVEKAEKKLNPDATYITANFEIEGMSCAMGCAKVIEKNIAKMDGVKEVEVDFENKTAQVLYDEELADQASLIQTVSNTSEAYKVTSWNGTSLVGSE